MRPNVVFSAGSSDSGSEEREGPRAGVPFPLSPGAASLKLGRNAAHLSALSGYHCVYNRVEAPCNFALEIGLYR